MPSFLLPQLGADMSEGKLLRWMKKIGERVERGDIIAVVETDKAAVDVEAYTPGVLAKTWHEPSDDWLPVGTPLAWIAVEGEPVPSEPPRAVAPSEQLRAPRVVPESATATPPTSAPASAPTDRIRASPRARRLAEERHVDLASLQGTGPDGRITEADVERAAKPAPAVDRAARMREAIASAMSRAKREIPHYYLASSIDMSRALEWLDAYNQGRPPAGRVLYGALLIKAVALALHETPELNGFWREGHREAATGIHPGIAISLRGGGLVAPALHDADKQPVPELMRAFQDLVARARAGSLKSSEMLDPTITITSLGERGVETVYGIIYPPQLALVGFGAIVRRPWVVEQAILPRPIIQATLSADHRASDGHRGALFLAAIDRHLQTPEAL